MTLNDVAYISEFSANLISVSKIVDRGATVVYHRDNATINNRAGDVLITVPRRINNLYTIRSAAQLQQQAHTRA